MIQIVGVLIGAIVMTFTITRMKKTIASGWLRKSLWLIFACYIAGFLYFTLFSREIGVGTQIELTPFQSYHRLFEKPIRGTTSVSGFASIVLKGLMPIEGLILNILLYYPLGYLLSILFPKLNPKHVILIGCLCSIATEATQYLLKMGWCETDDVIHNTLGTAIGVWVWLWQSKRLNAQRGSNPGKGET